MVPAAALNILDYLASNLTVTVDLGEHDESRGVDWRPAHAAAVAAGERMLRATDGFAADKPLLVARDSSGRLRIVDGARRVAGAKQHVRDAPQGANLERWRRVPVLFI